MVYSLYEVAKLRGAATGWRGVWFGGDHLWWSVGAMLAMASPVSACILDCGRSRRI